jgi:hypothetical protein
MLNYQRVYGSIGGLGTNREHTITVRTSHFYAFFSTYSAHPLQWSGWFAINVEIRDRLVDCLEPFVGLRGIKSVGK